jgi:flagellar biosynthesis protein FlhG
MNPYDPSDNVIHLNKLMGGRHRDPGTAESCRGKSSGPRVFAVTSGKGGVGKTNVVANLGHAMNRQGLRVLILDADLGLGNLDILLGLAPRFNLSHVLKGAVPLSEVLVQADENLRILPASSGIQEITRLSKVQRVRLFSEMDRISQSADVVLIDTAAGLSSNVMLFNAIAQDILVVATPEPTSITDAYALMKVLSLKYDEKRFNILVNMASGEREAKEVFRQLELVADRFLDISLHYLGFVPQDPNLTKGVRRQKLVTELFPDTKASRAFQELARKTAQMRVTDEGQGDGRLVWSQLVQNHFD